jgi:5'-nucleotidase
VAAARQAALLGVPAVAFSLLLDDGEPEFTPLATTVEQVLHLLLDKPAPPFVSVNLPPRPQGIRWTRTSVRRHSSRVIEGHDPRGRPHYWIDDDPLTDPQEDTDRWAVQNGYAAMTPLTLDVTDEAWLARMRPKP